MKNVICFLIVMLTSAACFAQVKDSTKPQVVYIFDKTDTVKVETMLFKGDGGVVKWCSPGWYIRKGQATVVNDKGQWDWIKGSPQVIAAFDDKKRPVKPIF